jgi:hypothetical protein
MEDKKIKIVEIEIDPETVIYLYEALMKEKAKKLAQ